MIPAIIEIANSTWWNTMRAVQKNRLADKLLQLGLQDRTQWLRTIANQGQKAVLELLNQVDEEPEE